jgi:hypothetical protein
MLIHVSRFTRVARTHQRTLVENTFDFYRRGIEMKIPSVLDELKKHLKKITNTQPNHRGEIFTETI